MSFDSFLPVVAFFEGKTLIAILIPLAAIALGGVITVSGMYFHHQQKKLLHETARLALEKGQPLPADLVAELNDSGHTRSAHRNQPQNDIRAGLILIAVGVGLYLFFAQMSLHSLRFVGTIPGFIGVALLLYGVIAALVRRKKPANDSALQA